MLTILRKKRQVRDFLTYDLEWIPGSLEVRMCGVYDGEQYRCYRSIDAFLHGELTHKNRGKWFYAHAGGLADIQFVFERIVEINSRDPSNPPYTVNASFSGSSAIIVKISRGRHTWIFVDSYWLLRDKLSNIGKWVGLDKGGLEEEEGLDDEDFDKFKEEKRRWFAEVPFDELRDYNERDCIILWRAINEFQIVLLELGGQLQMTLASSAMQLFRRKYLHRDINVGAYANHCSRDSYFASRVEVFQSKVKNSFYYDINSSFPYAMTFPCPGEYLGSYQKMPDHGIYIADVSVSVPMANITPVPIRLGGRVFFPSGTWRSWLTSVDIELLLQEGGRIEKCHEVLRFDEFNDLSLYCTDLYTRRKNSTNEFEKIVYKLLLNCLYGKFAESPYKSQLMINPREIDRTENQSAKPGMKSMLQSLVLGQCPSQQRV